MLIMQPKKYLQRLIDLGLKGIMFWEMTLDKPTEGLLDEIHKIKANHYKEN